MNRLKLGTKIFSGFGLLIFMAMALGGMAIYYMAQVDAASVKMDEQYVTEVTLLSQLERRAQRTMYNMRGYAMSEDRKYLEAGLKDLALVRQTLAETKSLVEKYPELVVLKQNVADATSKVDAYDSLAQKTVAGNDKLAQLRVEMDQAAGLYMQSCQTYLAGQNRKLEENIASGADAEALRGGTAKINVVNEIIDLGNDVRVKNFKSQATWDPALIEAGLKNFAVIEAKLTELDSLTKDAADKALIDKTKQASQAYMSAMTSFLTTWQEVRRLGVERGAVADGLLALARQTSLAGLKALNDLAEANVSDLNKATVIMLVGLAVALIVGVALALLITRSITRPVHVVVAGLSQGSGQVAAAANQVSTASQSLAEGAAQQAAALEETSSSLEEVSSMTKTNAESARQADNLMKEARAVVDRANQAMGELSLAMQNISKAGEDTGKIIKTIDEIAFQTNLLALNAAVEAARAGEAGAGFAVVADEVRNLALRAAEAAKVTTDLIAGTIAKTKEGSELLRKTDQAFDEVGSSSLKVADLISEIAVASAEQAQGLDQVSKAMDEIDKVTQQNAANAEESAAASEELSAQAETMQEFVIRLTEVVGSSENGAGHQALPEARGNQRRMVSPGARLNPPTQHKRLTTGKFDAKKAIPMDSSDFSEF